MSLSEVLLIDVGGITEQAASFLDTRILYKFQVSTFPPFHTIPRRSQHRGQAGSHKGSPFSHFQEESTK